MHFKEFDELVARFADEPDPNKAESIRESIWERFGTEGTVFISDMASFSSTSRKIGVLHFLKMIHRARQIIAPIIEANNGMLLKCDADNCYAFFKKTDHGRILLVGDIDFYGDPVNTASKLGEDLAVREEVLVTRRAIEHSNFEIPELAERMTARISEIEIQYVRLPMTEFVKDD